MDSLSPRELAYLKHRQAGLSDASIALLWDCSAVYPIGLHRVIKARLEVGTVEEAIALAARRLAEEVHSLPMDGRMKRRLASRPGFRWTERRLTVLRAVQAGTPRGVACAALGITRATFSEHLRQMKKAARVRTPEQLLQWATERGLLPLAEAAAARPEQTLNL